MYQHSLVVCTEDLWFLIRCSHIVFLDADKPCTCTLFIFTAVFKYCQLVMSIGYDDGICWSCKYNSHLSAINNYTVTPGLQTKRPLLAAEKYLTNVTLRRQTTKLGGWLNFTLIKCLHYVVSTSHIEQNEKIFSSWLCSNSSSFQTWFCFVSRASGHISRLAPLYVCNNAKLY